MGALVPVCGAKMVLVGAARPEKIEVVSHVDFLHVNWALGTIGGHKAVRLWLKKSTDFSTEFRPPFLAGPTGISVA